MVGMPNDVYNINIIRYVLFGTKCPYTSFMSR